jgi:hypothetical protein
MKRSETLLATTLTQKTTESRATEVRCERERSGSRGTNRSVPTDS